MRKVDRREILGRDDYESRRGEIRRGIFAVKQARRIHLGQYLTFLFENADTVRYQIQEMLRAEARWDEKAVEHELTTYNELLGGPGELGCTLMIELDDPLERDLVLRKWTKLPAHVYLRLTDGHSARARYDARQVGEDRLSAVQYLKFSCGDCEPAAVGLDMPGLEIEQDLTDEQRAALSEDLRS